MRVPRAASRRRRGRPAALRRTSAAVCSPRPNQRATALSEQQHPRCPGRTAWAGPGTGRDGAEARGGDARGGWPSGLSASGRWRPGDEPRRGRRTNRTGSGERDGGHAQTRTTPVATVASARSLTGSGNVKRRDMPAKPYRTSRGIPQSGSRPPRTWPDGSRTWTELGGRLHRDLAVRELQRGLGLHRAAWRCSPSGRTTTLTGPLLEPRDHRPGQPRQGARSPTVIAGSQRPSTHCSHRRPDPVQKGASAVPLSAAAPGPPSSSSTVISTSRALEPSDGPTTPRCSSRSMSRPARAKPT